MKRKISVFLCILNIVCVALPAMADEILFREIPWGSSIDQVMDALDIQQMYPNDKAHMPYWESINNYYEASTDYPTGWEGGAYLFGKSLKVAGYPLDEIYVYCAYGLDGNTVLRDKANSRFYAAKYIFDVLDVDAAYEDLKAKLSALYGQCEETVVSDEGFVIDANGRTDFLSEDKNSVWYGDNDTCVILTSSTTEPGDIMYGMYEYLYLSYGKTSFDDELKRIDAAVYNEMLQQESESRNNSVDGL